MILALLFHSTVASAQQEICSGALPVGEWREAMGAAERALVDLEGSRADRILDDVVYELKCLDVVARPEDIGRVARLLSLIAFWQQDNEEMSYWGLLARKTVGGADWPTDMPVPDRYFELMDALELPDALVEDGAGLDVPVGGGALLDGVFVPLPIAEPATQHLLQVVDKRGRVIYTSWMDGTRWPSGWLSEDASPVPVPDWYEPPAAPPEWSPLPPVAVVDPEDVGPEAPEDAPPESPEDAPPEDAPPEAPEDAPSEAPEDAPSEAPEDPPPEAPEDAPSEAPEDAPSEAPEDAPPEAPEDAPPEPPEDASAATLGKLRLLEQRRTGNLGTVTFEGDGRDPTCPWKADPRKVEATRREVVINRHSYDIRTGEGQAELRKVLRSCGEYRAVRRFKRWTEARGPFSGAGGYRDAMIEALVTEEPRRNKGD